MSIGKLGNSKRRLYLGREIALFLFVGVFLGLMASAFVGSQISSPRATAVLVGLLPFALLLLFRVAYRRRTGHGLVEAWAEIEARRTIRKNTSRQLADSARLAKVHSDPMSVAPALLTISFWNVLGLVLLLYACALVGAQVLYWLQTGKWLALPFIILFAEHFDDGPWLLNLVPHFYNQKALGYLAQFTQAKWIGVQKIVSWVAMNVPLSLTGYVLSLLAFREGWRLADRPSAP